MPTIFTKGDLFATAGIDAYAIGVSAAGTMDAGTAVAFRKKWPAFYDAYKAACARGLPPGEVFAWRGDDARVYALVLSKDEATSAQLPAFMKALTRMLTLAGEAKVSRLAMPRVGTKTARTQHGAGIDWTRVKKVLSEEGDKIPVSLVVVEQFIRGKDALEGVAVPSFTAPDEELGEDAALGGEDEAPRKTRRAKAKTKKVASKPKRAAREEAPTRSAPKAPAKKAAATRPSAPKRTSRSEGPARRSEGPARRSEGPGRRSEGPGRRPEGPARRSEGPARRSEGPGRRPEGPARRSEGPARRSDGPARRPAGPARRPAGPARRPEGSTGRSGGRTKTTPTKKR